MGGVVATPICDSQSGIHIVVVADCQPSLVPVAAVGSQDFTDRLAVCLVVAESGRVRKHAHTFRHAGDCRGGGDGGSIRGGQYKGNSNVLISVLIGCMNVCTWWWCASIPLRGVNRVC